MNNEKSPKVSEVKSKEISGSSESKKEWEELVAFIIANSGDILKRLSHLALFLSFYVFMMYCNHYGYYPKGIELGDGFLLANVLLNAFFVVAILLIALTAISFAFIPPLKVSCVFLPTVNANFWSSVNT